MSLIVNNNKVTREGLKKNYDTLHDPIRNYTPFLPTYNPPSTVGFTLNNETANEQVYKAGLQQAQLLSLEKRNRLRMLRLALERKRKMEKMNNGPSVKPIPGQPVLRTPALGHS